MKPTVAIDGPAGAGKSTVAKEVAKKLNIDYLDTGAMYRAVTYYALKDLWDLHNEEELSMRVKELDIKIKTSNNGETITIINEEDVTPFIRSSEINRNVSFIAKSPSIRQKLVLIQRTLGENGGIVMDGRDIGTRVLPNAPYKFFLTASLKERAKRRYNEFVNKDFKTNIYEVEKDIAIRDDIDKTRDVDPLKIPEDADVIDTTNLTINEVVEVITKKMINSNEVL